MQTQRLDRWLKKRFPQLSQVAIEKMCRKGELRIDGGRVKAATRIGAVGQRSACRRCPNPAPRPNGPNARLGRA